MERSKMAREEKHKKGQEEEGQERDPVGVLQRGENGESLFSPRFKSVAAMAGWDEESIIMATLIVEDTPVRDRFRNSNNKRKKRQDSNHKTPSTTSSRKRRGNRRISIPVPVPILNLEEDEAAKEGQEKRESEPQIVVKDKEKATKRVSEEKSEDVKSEKSSSSALPCLDKLREELSCAICLEICFEPSTTSCGHSFCKKCLRSAADKCGRKCPKCRQLISNGRSCTVNTVLWNTIQLLFPGEVEARKASMEVQNSREAKRRSPGKTTLGDVRSRGDFRPSTVSSTNFYGNGRSREMLIQDEDSGWRQRLRREDPSGQINRDTAGGRTRRRRGITNQDEDAALALRLQREELMESFRGGGPNEQSVNSVSLARENLRRLSRLVRQPNRRM